MLAILFGLILGIVHFFSDRIHLKYSEYRMKTASFTAGIFISYLFLHLFPQLYGGSELTLKTSLIFVLFGFSFLHLVEKYIYRHARRNQLRRELKATHSVTFFVYHFVLGLILVNLLAKSIVGGVLFFIPVFTFAAVSSISMKEIYHLVLKKGYLRVLLSASSLLGVLLATFASIPAAMYAALLGIIVGTMLHIAIMDAIPKEREGRPGFFVLGVVLYTVAIAVTWIA